LENDPIYAIDCTLLDFSIFYLLNPAIFRAEFTNFKLNLYMAPDTF